MTVAAGKSRLSIVMSVALPWPGSIRPCGNISATSMSSPKPATRVEPRAGVTELLMAWRGGDEAALDALMPLVRADLGRLARRQMRGERVDHTLQATALVSEAYLRLRALRQVQWQDRGHFFATAARLMRRVLVDHARTRLASKRGGGMRTVPLDAAAAVAEDRDARLVALDDALRALAIDHPRKASVVELRYFAGLSVADTAAALDVSQETVLRDWRFAKLWLFRALTDEAGS